MTTTSNGKHPQAVWIDTNVLVYANLALSPFHQAALEQLETLDQQGSELWLSRQTLREYLAVLTKPQVLTAPIPVTALATDVRYFSTRFLVGEDGPQVTENLLDLLTRFPTGGRQVHDANIVATMLRYGVTDLLTHNVKDFVRFASVINILPLVRAT
jgi:predicted nucleic acid-binding protein